MENNVFKNALSNFTFDMAARGSIRHLCDLGLSVDEIREKLSFPVPAEQIRAEINAYKKELSDRESSGYEFIKTTDEYGRSSFIRVPRT